MGGDLIIQEHKEQHYKVLFNKITGAFVRMEDKGYAEPFWSYKGPELLDVSITNYCERECPFCYRRSSQSGSHMTLEDLNSVVKEASKIGVLQIALGGGNPNQHPNFCEILREIRSAGIIPSYTTNGNGLTTDVLKATSLYCGAMAISLYEPYDESYYEGLIKRIISYGIKVNIHIILKTDTIESIIKWLQFPPKYMLVANAIIFLNYKPVYGDTSLCIKKHNAWQSFFHSVNSCKKLKIGFDSCSVPGIVSWLKPLKKELIEPCEAARFSAFISEDLKMYPCSFMANTEMYGDLRKDKLINIWQKSEVFTSFRNEMLNNSCKECINEYLCHGGCHYLPVINCCRKQ
jgi:radical SAM protein with 4Fe4S-binding SPASM domain